MPRRFRNDNFWELDVCVQPPTSAVNVTLPAFAAERHAAAPLLLSAGAGSCRSISPARKVLCSKPAKHAAAAVDRLFRYSFL